MYFTLVFSSTTKKEKDIGDRAIWARISLLGDFPSHHFFHDSAYGILFFARDSRSLWTPKTFESFPDTIDVYKEEDPETILPTGEDWEQCPPEGLSSMSLNPEPSWPCLSPGTDSKKQETWHEICGGKISDIELLYSMDGNKKPT